MSGELKGASCSSGKLGGIRSYALSGYGGVDEYIVVSRSCGMTLRCELSDITHHDDSSTV